jgi:hypothetical protein
MGRVFDGEEKEDTGLRPVGSLARNDADLTRQTLAAHPKEATAKTAGRKWRNAVEEDVIKQ